MKVAKADQFGELIGRFSREMKWNQEPHAIQKYAAAPPADEAIVLVQRRFQTHQSDDFLRL
jgi:hypothetical protein